MLGYFESILALSWNHNFQKLEKLQYFEKTSMRFFKTMVGTFCATCTVTGYLF